MRFRLCVVGEVRKVREENTLFMDASRELEIVTKEAAELLETRRTIEAEQSLIEENQAAVKKLLAAPCQPALQTSVESPIAIPNPSKSHSSANKVAQNYIFGIIDVTCKQLITTALSDVEQSCASPATPCDGSQMKQVYRMVSGLMDMIIANASRQLIQHHLEPVVNVWKCLQMWIH